MQPEVIKQVNRNEVQLLLKWHTRDTTIETVWNTETEQPQEIQLTIVNPRVNCPLLSLDTLEKFRVFLDRNGLKMSVKEIDAVLQKARERYGVGNGTWLNCCRLNDSLHGLCSLLKIRDGLLIQNGSECWQEETGMFTIKRKLLNRAFRKQKSSLQFIKTYTVRRPI